MMKIKPSREQQEYLIDRWAPIVEGAGISVRGLTAFDIYLLAKTVLNNPAMTDEEKAAARRRIKP